MSTFANLHQLPAWQALFTYYVTPDPQGTPVAEMVTEEIDLVLDRRMRHNLGDLLAAVKGELAMYDEGVRVCAIICQPGEVVYDAR